MDKFKDASFQKHPKNFPIIVNFIFESWAPKVSVDGMKFKINEQKSTLAKKEC